MVKVAIDIGHGSDTFPENGKGVHRGGKGYAEHDFNSKVAKNLKAKLEASGINVVYGPQKPNSLDVGLTTRTNWYNRNGVDIVISIHANAGGASANGICAFYWNTSGNGKSLAQNVVNQVQSKGYSTHGNGLHAGVVGSWTNLHITRETNMPAVLVEHGFMTNSGDFQNIFGSNQANYVEDMADADARAVCNYFGVSYKGGSVSDGGSDSVSSASSSASSSATSKVEKVKDTWRSFTLGYDIKVRSAPSTSAELVFTGAKGDTINYDSVYTGNRYNWISYFFKEQRVYLPYNEIGGNDWGDFGEPTKPKPDYLKQGGTHTVQKGDTLYSIAQENGTTADKLSDINNISDAKALKIGQVLQLDESSNVEPAKSGDTYTVQKGDTLYGIAEDHGTTTQVIKEANNIDNPDLLSVGQKLKIVKPSKEKKESSFRSLSKGDTATIGIWAKQYQTGENISDWIKGTPLKVDSKKEVNQSNSKYAYKLLNNGEVIGWVLEQDIVEADKGQHKGEIQEMKNKREAVESGEAKVVEEKSVEEAKKEEPNEPKTYKLEEGQFILDGKKYQVTKLK